MRLHLHQHFTSNSEFPRSTEFKTLNTLCCFPNCASLHPSLYNTNISFHGLPYPRLLQFQIKDVSTCKCIPNLLSATSPKAINPLLFNPSLTLPSQLCQGSNSSNYINSPTSSAVPLGKHPSVFLPYHTHSAPQIPFLPSPLLHFP